MVSGGGGATAGDVGEGGDICHAHKHTGEVGPSAGHATAPGHAEIHEHHQRVARIRVYSVRCGGEDPTQR